MHTRNVTCIVFVIFLIKGEEIMKKMCMALVCVFVSVLFSVNVNADLLEYEGFDYSGTNINGQSGGTGWGGAWSDTDTDLNLSDDNSSLNSWPFPYTHNGARILDKNMVVKQSVPLGQPSIWRRMVSGILVF